MHRKRDKTKDLEQLARRAWQAYLALPLTNDHHPAYKSLEDQEKLPNEVLSKLFKGKKGLGGAGQAVKIAKVLGSSLDWLLYGVGTPPTPRPPFRQCPVDAEGSGQFTVWHNTLEQAISRRREPIPEEVLSYARLWAASPEGRMVQDWTALLDQMVSTHESRAAASKEPPPKTGAYAIVVPRKKHRD